MTQIDLCPDLQSPELSIPCPTHSPLEPGGGLTALPDTGLDFWPAIIVATILILIGAGIWLYEKHLEKQADDATS